MGMRPLLRRSYKISFGHENLEFLIKYELWLHQEQVFKTTDTATSWMLLRQQSVVEGFLLDFKYVIFLFRCASIRRLLRSGW